MFIFIAIVFVIIGILLFIKSNKIDNPQGVKLIVKISSVGMIILGIGLFCYMVIGNAMLPLE
ncbi:MAG: hypothetical protein R3Y09_09705 [Clostridia bacterium]